jgi:DNA transposition AAA+ family ATPase
MKKNMLLTDQLRQAIESCGKTRYALAKETGVGADTLCRFVNGERGLSMEAMDAIGKCLGLRIVADEPKAEKGK